MDSLLFYTCTQVLGQPGYESVYRTEREAGRDNQSLGVIAHYIAPIIARNKVIVNTDHGKLVLAGLLAWILRLDGCCAIQITTIRLFLLIFIGSETPGNQMIL